MSLPRPGRYGRGTSAPGKVDQHMLLKCRVRLSVLSTAVAVLIVGAARTPVIESWDAVYLAGSKVGYVHTFVEPVKDRAASLCASGVDMKLSYKRLGDRVSIRMQYGTIETLDGAVLRLDTRIPASEQEMRATATSSAEDEPRSSTHGGQRQQQSIDWGPRRTRALRRRAEPLPQADEARRGPRTLKMSCPTSTGSATSP